MKDLHCRYEYSTGSFKYIDNNAKLHHQPLFKHIYVPTLVIDIDLVEAKNITSYVTMVLDRATEENIQYKQILFDSTLEPMFHYDEKVASLNQIAKIKSTRCLLMTSRYETQKHSHLIEFIYPSWMFVFKQLNPPNYLAHPKTHGFSCLNRNPLYHRLLFYTLLKRTGLIDQMIFSFYNQCPYQKIPVHSGWYTILRGLAGEELFQESLRNLTDFPISWEEEIETNPVYLAKMQGDHTTTHDAYTSAWCNIVTESSAVIPFTSEKIWKPIASGQLFLTVAAPGTNQWLRSLGFHPIADDYDSDTNIVTRFEKIINIVKEHASDPAEWYRRNKFHVEHNYYWFHSGNLEKSIIDHGVALLNSL